MREYLKDQPLFFEDTRLDLRLRTSYFLEEHPNDSKREEWAGGRSIAHESGWLLDRVAVGAEIFTSQKLYGPLDRAKPVFSSLDSAVTAFLATHSASSS